MHRGSVLRRFVRDHMVDVGDEASEEDGVDVGDEASEEDGVDVGDEASEEDGVNGWTGRLTAQRRKDAGYLVF